MRAITKACWNGAVTISAIARRMRRMSHRSVHAKYNSSTIALLRLGRSTQIFPESRRGYTGRRALVHRTSRRCKALIWGSSPNLRLPTLSPTGPIQRDRRSASVRSFGIVSDVNPAASGAFLSESRMGVAGPPSGETASPTSSLWLESCGLENLGDLLDTAMFSRQACTQFRR